MTSATPTVVPQNGLGWEMDDWSGPQPIWTVEPNTAIIAKIVRRELALSEDATCEVSFLAEGSLNKVYAIQCDGSCNYIMRATLPVQPRLKTMSEIATVSFVSTHTDIPTPKIFAVDHSNKNELGFEWMMMERVAGHPIEMPGDWSKVNWLKKEVLVRKIISYMVQLFQKRFKQIGSLYIIDDLQQLPKSERPSTAPVTSATPEGIGNSKEYHLSDIISVPFFYIDHLTHDVPRGTFHHSRDWLAARLQFHINDANNIPQDADEDTIAIKKCTKLNAERLLKILTKVLPTNEPDEEFVLHHHNLSSRNILMDDSDDLAGVVDWERVHTVPLWYACQLPKFLNGNHLEHCPEPDTYGKTTNEDGTEEINEGFWRHLQDYEKTRLRAFFFEQMERECPEWVKIHNESKLKVDFELAVEFCPFELGHQMVTDWLDEIESGKEPSSLKDACRG
ncbi:hypothetical protein K505DRAFT_308861 [Melanomma pulvis-pyrius CBS 109.77]|uniref:Aminoglycoside phosphotransferase domain-containing protein n=1 Tax=Melanomma pulvis-pyrius CBS 109.77 TaxID=1314802 RepID=A0A6A6X786_9PLEO|nr:hypothetical protein K505DRAFT_308861 [Melanomma pulvis-pyrius CBS 109.77]